MPELLMERPKMSLQMHETLKKYILSERKRKKEEDEISEQKIREEMKKVEMNTQTLEQNKSQLKQLEIKLDDLQLKRRELFNQLKKVLNEETTLKKNSRPQINTLTPQNSNVMLQQMGGAGSGNPLNYQQLITSQLQQQHESVNIFPAPSLMSGGPPQIVNQPNQGPLSAPSAKTPPNPQNNIVIPAAIPSPSLTANSKPQSPFHHPQLLHHLGPNFPLIPPGSLKYGIPTPLSPQILTAHQHASPSSSPRHHITQNNNSSNTNTAQTPNSKRPRSPSPRERTSASPANSVLSQFVFNQNQLTPSRSPANLAAAVAQSPPPPSSINQQIFNNSPSSTKKSRSNNLMPPNPSSNSSQSERQHQNRQNYQSNLIPPSGLTPQQQSAFSAYHQSLIIGQGRPGALNSFQPSPQQQQQQSASQVQHNKLNKSPNLQSFNPNNQPQMISPQHQSNTPNFLARGGSNNNIQSPSQLPPPSHSPLNFNSMTNHYLKQLAQEATHKLFQQQVQNQHQPQNLQQHLLHQQQQQQQLIHQQQIMVAAAAVHNEMNANGNNSASNNPNINNNNNNNNRDRLSQSSGPSTVSGGGSILTGFSRSSSNPSQQQRPPSNY